MTGEKIDEMSFEQALAELENVVRALEDGNVPLEESISLYERGEMLRKHCEGRLKAAQLKVDKITGAGDGQPQTEPFENG